MIFFTHSLRLPSFLVKESFLVKTVFGGKSFLRDIFFGEIFFLEALFLTVWAWQCPKAMGEKGPLSESMNDNVACRAALGFPLVGYIWLSNHIPATCNLKQHFSACCICSRIKTKLGS